MRVNPTIDKGIRNFWKKAGSATCISVNFVVDT